MEPITPTAVVTTTVVSGAQSVLARLDPWMMTVIILGTLIALMGSLWLVYQYINKIRISEIHTLMLYESVYNDRLRRLQEQAGLIGEDGWGDAWETDPDELENQRQSKLSWLSQHEGQLAELKEKLQLSEEDKKEIADIREAQAELAGPLSEASIKKVREEKQQREQTRKDRENQIRATAEREAKILVPESLTVAGMGITGSFFIELTAILTIIFGIIILGLTGALGTAEIAPILAAIAGYVLGKTTSGWAPYGGGAWLQQPFTPQAPASPRPPTGE